MGADHAEGQFTNRSSGQFLLRRRRLLRNEFVGSIAQKADISQDDAKKVIKAFAETVTEALAQGDNLALIGFGTFEVRDRAARKGRNPRTGEEVQIPASKLPAFRPGKSLKEAVNKK